MKYFILLRLYFLCIPLIISSYATTHALQAPSYCGIAIDTTLKFSFAGTPQTQFSRYRNSCSGPFQSPINIADPFIFDPIAFIRFSPSAYTAAKVVTAYNPGHAPHIIPLPSSPRVYVNFRGVVYTLANVHFHTGKNDAEGSMHTLYGKRFPLEVHLQWFQEKFVTLRDALKTPGGVLITATLYQIGPRDPQLDNILAQLPKISRANQTTNYSPNPVTGTIANLMADPRSKFYTFPGSIEVPPCSNTVLWLVFDTVKSVSSQQMAGFRNVLRTYHGNLQVKNWRYTQPTTQPLYVTPAMETGTRDTMKDGADTFWNETISEASIDHFFPYFLIKEN